jgi:hypothetical protein
MPISNRLAFRHWSTSDGLSSRTALYGPVRRVVWQGSVGDRRPYADRIRQFGFLGNACRTKLIAVSRQLLAFTPDDPSPSTALPPSVVWKCPHCGAPMRILEKLSTLQLESRCRFIDTS